MRYSSFCTVVRSLTRLCSLGVTRAAHVCVGAVAPSFDVDSESPCCENEGERMLRVFLAEGGWVTVLYWVPK